VSSVWPSMPFAWRSNVPGVVSLTSRVWWFTFHILDVAFKQFAGWLMLGCGFDWLGVQSGPAGLLRCDAVNVVVDVGHGSGNVCVSLDVIRESTGCSFNDHEFDKEPVSWVRPPGYASTQGSLIQPATGT